MLQLKRKKNLMDHHADAVGAATSAWSVLI